MKTAQQLKYAWYVIFHPFKGFWDLKHEKKGGVTAASILLAAACLLSILQYTLTGYVVSDNSIQSFNIFLQIAIPLVPFVLWCVANWGTTTLMDGEGSFRDIYIATGYALTPVILIQTPLILLSNVINLEEVPFYIFFANVSTLWMVLLIFVGTMTIHQYSGAKTLMTSILTIVGMAILVFLALLFVALIQQVAAFIGLVYKEIALRM